MIVELIELTMNNDGVDVFDMLKEIGPGENGYVNDGCAIQIDELPAYLKKCDNMSKAIDLAPHIVPQTTFWLYIDCALVGVGELRHYLNENLKIRGGNISYTIRPSQRGKGYGTVILQELLKKAKDKDIEKILITCSENNLASRKVIEKNGCILASINNGECSYRKTL